ncbi:tyrosine-type recombinase/integrase [Sedimentisphaera salicampi]|uniref:Site-specific tyrosine recombinase XerC n=1 Tax=Sedimentisphaera salicampi TaxID=1941349 RepID=A0A1W6LK76_9BACT|nr:site-specific integrase [Sedimentisphaera salicampi]ARN56152.1 site-specific tyrosine recombinase XerC [Sedimentisphaera salicampi]
MKAKNKLPGTIQVKRGRYYWMVKLPGKEKRKMIKICPPGEDKALSAEKDISLAQNIAWQIYRQAKRKAGPKQSESLSVDEVIGLFLEWAKGYYINAAGEPTREAENCNIALRDLQMLYGAKDIDSITYHDILAARKLLIDRKYNRNYINQRVGIWKRMFAWALENRYCSASVKSEVWAIGSLKKNRCVAAESSPVHPAPHWAVKKVLPYLSENMKALVQFIELTGARPGEAIIVRPCDIKRLSAKCWVYWPFQHKNKHKNRHRFIVLGPRAIRIIKPFMLQYKKKSEEFLFPGKKGGYYSRTAISYAIRKAIDKINQSEDEDVPHWSPNQLRHSCGTRVRKKFGADAARIILGHSNPAGITDRYTRDAIIEEEIKQAKKVMRQIG